MSKQGIPDAWAEHADIIERVRELGEEGLALDLDDRFVVGADDAEPIRTMADAGLLGLTLPILYGGMGRDYTALAAVCEALGRIDTAHQVALTVHLALCGLGILQWGTDSQRAQWLPTLARGERLGTFALTEPGAGSDVGALRMRARRAEGGYVLNGEKTWISSVSYSDLLLMFATVDPALRHKGITAFIVDRDTPGITTATLHGKFGLRVGNTGSIACNNVFVPDSNILGDIGEGFVVALSVLGNGLFTVGAGALGIATECRHLAGAFLQDMGAAASGLHGAALARMYLREQEARLLIARAAALKNTGTPNAQETGVAKWTAARAAYDNASEALDIVQAHQTGEHPSLLRHWANAKAAVIYGGTSEIHQGMQAAYALGSRSERPYRRPSLTAADLA